MNQCEKYSLTLPFYLENELEGDKQSIFHAHLKDCAYCKAQLQAEHEFSDLLRRSRPTFRASDELRSRVEGIVG
jgi:hypothetical protein